MQVLNYVQHLNVNFLTSIQVYNAVQLLEYCQGFLLQNMVALLTYDDSVRRLIFGKKLHNHDVLAGLLLTLQARIKSRSQHKLNKWTNALLPWFYFPFHFVLLLHIITHLWHIE